MLAITWQIQEICPLAGRGLLHEAERRVTPTMTQTDSLHLTASFAALHCNCGAATHVQKQLLPADFFHFQSFHNRTALVDEMRKESTFLFILRNIMTSSFSSVGRELASPLNFLLTYLTNELFQFRCPCHSFGGCSLSSEMLPEARLLHSQVWSGQVRHL